MAFYLFFKKIAIIAKTKKTTEIQKSHQAYSLYSEITPVECEVMDLKDSLI